jgi:hypothetical protein
MQYSSKSRGTPRHGPKLSDMFKFDTYYNYVIGEDDIPVRAILHSKTTNGRGYTVEKKNPDGTYTDVSEAYDMHDVMQNGRPA